MTSTTMSDPMLHIRGLPVNLPSVSWWLERLPLAVLILSITFLQGYSLLFWDGLLGTSGWGVSLGLEVLHLWFWYRAATSARFARFGWMVLAIAATGLLLAGALHEVSRPLLQESARIEVADQEQASLQDEVRVLKSNLDAYREMAAGQGRRGWRNDIRQDTDRLTEINNRLQALKHFPGNRPMIPWLNQLTRWGVVAVAVLFQIAAVLAVWTLSAGSRKTIKPFRPDPEHFRNSKSVSERVETFRTPSKQPDTEFYTRLWKGIEAHAGSNSARLARGNGKISQASLARNIGISAPDLSGIKLLAQGQAVPRNPSKEAIVKLAKRFEIEMPK